MMTSPSSASPAALGTTNSATRMLLAAGRVCQAAGAEKVSGLAGAAWKPAAASRIAGTSVGIIIIIPSFHNLGRALCYKPAHLSAGGVLMVERTRRWIQATLAIV